jgi:hypothetical protein
VSALGGVDRLVVEHLVGQAGVDRLQLLFVAQLFFGVLGLNDLIVLLFAESIGQGDVLLRLAGGVGRGRC